MDDDFASLEGNVSDETLNAIKFSMDLQILCDSLSSPVNATITPQCESDVTTVVETPAMYEDVSADETMVMDEQEMSSDESGS